MSKIAIVDIGSNTVVLNIYEKKDALLSLLQSHSAPVGLVRYIQSRHMQEEGIQAAVTVLHAYQNKIREQRVDTVYAFITEPARRIDNRSELLSAFQQAGFNVDALSGEQEATYDYLGTRMDCARIQTGIAFDVGGGSTELIAFQNEKVLEAVSLPLGCVRLQTLPVTDETVDTPIRLTLRNHPRLTSVPSATVIGIGGTCRAAASVLHSKQCMHASALFDLRDRLKQNDPDSVARMQEAVATIRQAVFLPGLNMICAILKAFGAETIRLSTCGVREGYLLAHTD